MRIINERMDADLLETRAYIAAGALFHEAYNFRTAVRSNSPSRTVIAEESLDFGPAENLYRNTAAKDAHRGVGVERQTVKTAGPDSSMRSLSQSIQSAENSKDNNENENTPAEDEPSQVDSMPENTPANFNVETPSAGSADEAPESNTNSGRGVPDSDPVPTENNPVVPVAALAVANSNTFSPCCNSTNQVESPANDQEGINAEGETGGTPGSSSNSDDGSNSNAPGSDADGNNGSDGTSSGQGDSSGDD